MGNKQGKKAEDQPSGYTGTNNEYKVIFSDCDKDMDGFMNKEELNDVFKRFGVKVSQVELDTHFKEADTRQDGRLSLKEFTDFMHRHPAIKSLEQTFSIFDLDGNGSITVSELKKCMYELGKHVNSKQLAQMFRAIDINNDSRINFEEFAGMMAKNRVLSLQEVFKNFDTNRDGFISKSELLAAFRAIGVNASSADIAKIFVLADAEDDGKLTFEEFARFLEDE